MTIACNRLIVLSLRSLQLLFDDAESNSMSESLSLCSCVLFPLPQLSLGEHLAESSRISKLSNSSNGLLYFWRFVVFEFVIRLQFSSESTLRRPYAFRGGRWLLLSAKKSSKIKINKWTIQIPELILCICDSIPFFSIRHFKLCKIRYLFKIWRKKISFFFLQK